jgi:hypothetical protein
MIQYTFAGWHRFLLDALSISLGETFPPPSGKASTLELIHVGWSTVLVVPMVGASLIVQQFGKAPILFFLQVRSSHSSLNSPFPSQLYKLIYHAPPKVYLAFHV